MAKWRRGHGHRRARWEVVWLDDGDTLTGSVGAAEGCDQPVAACAELAPCAAVLVETDDQTEGTPAGTE